MNIFWHHTALAFLWLWCCYDEDWWGLAYLLLNLPLMHLCHASKKYLMAHSKAYKLQNIKNIHALSWSSFIDFLLAFGYIIHCEYSLWS